VKPGRRPLPHLCYIPHALEIFERLGTLLEPDKERKELAELPA
jgi:hypothetical protein